MKINISSIFTNCEIINLFEMRDGIVQGCLYLVNQILAEKASI